MPQLLDKHSLTIYTVVQLHRRASIPATRAPRVPSNLAEQKEARRPTTFKEQQAQLTQADMASNGHISPTKTESSYKTAVDIDGDQERSNDGVRPPSTYSHDSIGGGVIPYQNNII